MKKFTLLAVLALTISMLPIHAFAAAAVSAEPYERTFTSNNLGTSSWSPVVTSTQRLVTGLSVLNTSQAVIQIGVAIAGSTADSEVAQLYVMPRSAGAGGGAGSDMLVLPVKMSNGVRLSIKAKSSSASTGGFWMNVLY